MGTMAAEFCEQLLYALAPAGSRSRRRPRPRHRADRQSCGAWNGYMVEVMRSGIGAIHEAFRF